MRTILSFLLIMVIHSFSFAQSDSSNEHLKFKGVPIDGTLSGFVDKMKEHGFVLEGTSDGTAILEGDFAGYKNCEVNVATLKQKDLVSHILVLFPEKENWSALSSDYFHLKELLTEKYGNPTKVVEKFTSDHYGDDGLKMIYVRSQGCKYYSSFATNRGTIILAIHSTEFKSCVSLSYKDKVNSNIIRAKAIDDL